MSRSRRWRKKLKCLIVQLKGRTSVEPRTLRRLHLHDSLTIRQNGRVFDVPLIIFVDLSTTFRTQHLV